MVFGHRTHSNPVSGRRRSAVLDSEERFWKSIFSQNDKREVLSVITRRLLCGSREWINFLLMTIDPLVEAVEARIAHLGWKKNYFCEQLAISTQTYNNWRTRGIPQGRRYEVAKLLGCRLPDRDGPAPRPGLLVTPGLR